MLPLLLATMGSVDPRLDVKATLLQPRVTYAELGAWVQKSSGVPILVSPAIRERKATVLVEDRPVRETMDRVAEALFLEWEPTERGGGYTLKLRKDVAAEEVAANAALAEMRERGLWTRLNELSELAPQSPSQIEALRDQAKGESGTAALDAQARLNDALKNPALPALGGVLAKLGLSGRTGLASGGRIFASDVAGPNVATVPPSAISGLRLGGLNLGHGMAPGIVQGTYSKLPEDESHVAMMLGGDPKNGRLRVVVAFFDATGSQGSYEMQIDAGVRQSAQAVRYGTALGKRLHAWAAGGVDADVWRTAIRPAKRPVDAAPHHALAELLFDLHARTGVPIVADGFREAAWGSGTPSGATVREWATSLGRPSPGERAHPALEMRASGGWLMTRRQFYWERLAQEVPENPICRFEAASSGAQGPSLEDVAAFASVLTPSQVDHLEPPDLVMLAPNEALANNVSILRAWNELPEPLRRRARGRDGLLLESGTPGRLGFFDALADRCAESGDANLLALLLPGAALSRPPLLNVRTMNGTVEMSLGSSGKTLAFYTVPLSRPAR